MQNFVVYLDDSQTGALINPLHVKPIFLHVQTKKQISLHFSQHLSTLKLLTFTKGAKIFGPVKIQSMIVT